ncbi:MAG: pyridoxamine 5'-phosphate oxidase family protein [Halanaerobiales bacterium]
MNRKMNSIELKEHIIEFLKEHREASLATCLNNIPRSSPVQYFLGEDMNIYIFSAGGEKFRAIAENHNVCLLVNTEYINYRRIKGVQIFGKARTSDEDKFLMDEAQIYTPDPYLFESKRNDLKIIKIVPEEVVYLNSLVEGDRTKQVLKADTVEVREEGRFLVGSY